MGYYWRISLVVLCSLGCSTLALKLQVVRHDQITPPLRSEVFTTIDHGAYLVPVGIGSPPTTLYLILDVGTNALWVQSQPNSPSFAEVLPCGLEGCERLDNTHCHKGECVHKVRLLDKSYTEGKVGLDTITIGGMAIRNVAIACGYKNKNYFAQIPGLLGLGQDGRGMSLLSQLYQLTGGSFSYCLPSSGPGWLELGFEAFHDGPTWVSLLYNQWNPTAYYVELSGLGVGSRRVSLPKDIFKLTPKGDGGAIISTVDFATTLPKEAYEAFRDAYIAEASYLPRAPEDSIFDTCFNLTGLGTIQVPTVSFYFGEVGTTITFAAKNILYLVDRVGVFCFAFRPSIRRLASIGSFQQAGIQISIDSGGYLGFGPNVC